MATRWKISPLKKGFVMWRCIRSWPVSLYLIACAWAAFILYVFPAWYIDDAFITFRYAANLANHLQLTWNVSEPPVEGYTGVFLPVILALFAGYGFAPEFISKGIGVAAFFAGGLVLLSFLMRLRIRTSIQGMTLLLYFAAPAMSVHSLSGLETMLFTAVVLSCYFTFFLFLDSTKHSGLLEVILPVMLLWCSLVRPEGVVLALICAAVGGVAIIFSQTHAIRRYFLMFVIFYGLPMVGYLTWKMWYYKDLIPITYWTKIYAGRHFVNPESVISLTDFTIQYLAFPVLACIILSMINRSSALDAIAQGIKHRTPFCISSAALGLFILIVVFQYMRSNLVQGIFYRFFLPFFPIALVMIARWLEEALGWSELTTGLKRKSFVVLIVAAVSIQIAIYAVVLRETMSNISWSGEFRTNVLQPTFQFIRRTVPSSEWLIVYIDAGGVPYYTGLKTVDFGGLNDKFLAKRFSLSRKQIVDYFYSFDAGAVLCNSFKWDELCYTEELSSIVEDPRFNERYLLLRKFGMPRQLRYKHCTWCRERVHGFYYFLFLRKDLLPAIAENSISTK